MDSEGVCGLKDSSPMNTREVNNGLHSLMLIPTETLSNHLLQEVKSTSSAYGGRGLPNADVL